MSPDLTRIWFAFCQDPPPQACRHIVHWRTITSLSKAHGRFHPPHHDEPRYRSGPSKSQRGLGRSSICVCECELRPDENFTGEAGPGGSIGPAPWSSLSARLENESSRQAHRNESTTRRAPALEQSFQRIIEFNYLARGEFRSTDNNSCSGQRPRQVEPATEISPMSLSLAEPESLSSIVDTTLVKLSVSWLRAQGSVVR
ncbi:hypothetical protein BJY04DRAFT_80177 [Aspergillus karnatakaensis]|uniref:uncharacterized protein n=1 Tax=Aspergillus karnatakaensis TaxID=1810916 RepID=UPI003CCCE699